jgi:hypothetical protein
MSHQPKLAVINGDARLIAGSFYTQYAHNPNPVEARYQIYMPLVRSAMFSRLKKSIGNSAKDSGKTKEVCEGLEKEKERSAKDAKDAKFLIVSSLARAVDKRRGR